MGALDTTGRGVVAICTVCGAGLRTNMKTGARYCDRHPTAPYRWEPDVTDPEWEIDRDGVVCPSCGRPHTVVLLHPPIPRTVAVVFDAIANEECPIGECLRCGAEIPTPERLK